MGDMFLTDHRYTVFVDCTQPLERLIERGGFRFADPRITSERFRFSSTGHREAEIGLAAVATECELSTSQVLGWLESHHLRPARIEELLALALGLPTTRVPRNLYALGSLLCVKDGETCVVSCSLRRERILRLSKVKWEPWWCAIVDAFPCVRL